VPNAIVTRYPKDRFA